MRQDDIQDYIIGDIVEYDNEIMVVKRVGKSFIMLFSPKMQGFFCKSFFYIISVVEVTLNLYHYRL